MGITELKFKYEQLMHALQSGVKVSLETGSREGEPKHLRVGVNSALVTTSALVRLLVDKGILSEQEYWQAMNEALEKEVKIYERELKQKTGVDIRLY